MSERVKSEKRKKKGGVFKLSKDNAEKKPKANIRATPRNNLGEMIEKFESLFLNEDKLTNKNVRDFTKETFSYPAADGMDSVQLNYNNIVVFLLKFAGLDVESSPKLESLNEDLCTNFELLDEIIASCRVRSDKTKMSKVYSVFEWIVAELYNNYELTNTADFSVLQKFIANILKLTSNKYRKIRLYSTLILVNVFKLLIEEKSKTKKLLLSQSKNKKATLDSFVQSSSSSSVLNAKLKVLSDLVLFLNENFLTKKVTDVSKNIRMVICDYLVKISKSHLEELFSDDTLIKLYPHFLKDSSNNIKYKYLQLIYEKLDSTNFEEEEEQGETVKVVIRILSSARDVILKICVKEDKMIAKQGIKIIELLSQHNILEIKTVQSLLPHLFNPEPQIRTLITKVVINYILNFEKEDRGDPVEENDEDDEGRKSNRKSGPSPTSESKKVLTMENLIQTLEFIFKLTENDEKLVKVLVDNFYKKLNILTRLDLFFEAMQAFVNSDDPDSENLLQTLLLTLDSTVEKIQTEIESLSENDETTLKVLCPKNEEFLNLFLANVTGLIKIIRTDLSSDVKCENFNYLLQMFDRFRIYKINIVKFNSECLIELTQELKNSFFINMRGASFLQGDDFFENLMENLLKAIYRILSISNRSELAEMTNLKSAELENIIYSDSSSSLAKDFFEILYKEILSTGFFKTLANIKSDEFHLDQTASALISKNELMKTLYIILTQFKNLLVYFRDIFDTSSDVEDSFLNLFSFCNFLENLVRFLFKFINKKDEACIDYFYKVVNGALCVIETIHLINFNRVLNESNSEKIERYISHRNNIIITLSTIINEFKYEDFPDEAGKEYNNSILKLKTKAVNNLLEMFVYVCSEKIENPNVKFLMEDSLVEMLQDFLRTDFVNFYCEYNRHISKAAEKPETARELDPKNIVTQPTQSFKVGSKFNEELATKTFCYKLICEKFSRLLMLNVGIFKHTNLCCTYFEAFLSLKLPAVIDNLTSFVYESIVEKEIVHYSKTLNQLMSSPLNVVIFYLTKVAMRIFTHKSKLVDETIDVDERILMVGRIISRYVKTLKKLKTKYNKDSFDVMNKDKVFFENFLLNSINFALESRKEIINEDESVTIQIENIKIFEILKFFIKVSSFLSESDLKNVLMIFLRLAKPVELLENVNRTHLKLLDKFKSFLLTKAKVFICEEVEEKKDKEEEKIDPNDKMDISNLDDNSDGEEIDEPKEAPKKEKKVSKKNRYEDSDKKDEKKKKKQPTDENESSKKMEETSEVKHATERKGKKLKRK